MTAPSIEERHAALLAFVEKSIDGAEILRLAKAGYVAVLKDAYLAGIADVHGGKSAMANHDDVRSRITRLP